jgi:hypothetical protein
MNIKKLIFVMRETEPLGKSERKRLMQILAKLSTSATGQLCFSVYNAALKTTD